MIFSPNGNRLAAIGSETTRDPEGRVKTRSTLRVWESSQWKEVPLIAGMTDVNAAGLQS